MHQGWGKVSRLILAAVVAFGIGWAGRSVMSATAYSGCSDITIWSVRGSGETAADYGGYGKTMNAIRSLIAQRLAPSFTVQTIPLDYRAASVELLKPDGINVHHYATEHEGAFAASIDDGVVRLKAAIKQRLGACPGTRFILAGYSQGAMVVHQAQYELDEMATTAQVGTILVADGDRVPRSAARLFGTASAAASGVRTYLRDFAPNPAVRPTRDVRFPAETVMVTDSEDVVGDFNFRRLAGGRGAFERGAAVHTGYVDDRGGFRSSAIPDAVAELVSIATRAALDRPGAEGESPEDRCGTGFTVLETQPVIGGVVALLHRQNTLCAVTLPTRLAGAGHRVTVHIRHWNGTVVGDAKVGWAAGPVYLDYPGTVYWGGAIDAMVSERRLSDILKPGDSIHRGTTLWPIGFAYRAALQNDGNLVIYTHRTGRPVWATGPGGDRLTLQRDGNVVLAGPAGVVWTPHTQGSGADTLLFQRDGNLVLYGPGGNAIWASGTNGR